MKTAHPFRPLRSHVALAAALAAGAPALAGPITPPAGPVAPVYKTLDQVEPRRAVQSLPGDAYSQYVISEPGSYYLTGNIVGVTGKHGISITTSGVTLDLSGFALIGVEGAGAGITSWAEGYAFDNAVVNGAVRNWPERGIDFGGAANGRFEGLRVSHCGGYGMVVGPHSTVSGCEISASGAGGLAGADRLVVSDTTVNDSVGAGVTAGEMFSGRNVVCTYSGQEGFRVGSSATFSACIANNNTGGGFRFFDSCALSGCVASWNGGAGVFGWNGNTVTGGAFHSNTGHGIRVGSGCTVTQNTCRANVGDGIVLQNSNNVTGNTCDGNGWGGPVAAGIHVTGQANRIDSNAVIANDTGIDVDAGGNFVVRNTASFNSTRADIVSGNAVAQWIVGAGNAFVTTDPWANFGH